MTFISFIISANICYNLTYIIINHLKFNWVINPIFSFYQLTDYNLLFGTTLLTTLIILFVLKYDRDIKVKLEKVKKMPKEDGSFEYGSSRWATKKEIKDNFKEWNVGKKLKSGGIPATTIDGKHYYSDSFDYNLIIGSTGSGKTICEIMPLIFNLGYAGESMIINDTKGELYSVSYQFLKKQGYRIHVINLRDAMASDGWNPLHLPYKYFKNSDIDLAGDLIEKFAKSLTKNLSSKDMYWEKSATAVLTALCYAIIEEPHARNKFIYIPFTIC